MNKYPVTIFEYLANMDFIDYLSSLFTVLIILAYVVGTLYLLWTWFTTRGQRRAEVDEEEGLDFR